MLWSCLVNENDGRNNKNTEEGFWEVFSNLGEGDEAT